LAGHAEATCLPVERADDFFSGISIVKSRQSSCAFTKSSPCLASLPGHEPVIICPRCLSFLTVSGLYRCGRKNKMRVPVVQNAARDFFALSAGKSRRMRCEEVSAA